MHDDTTIASFLASDWQYEKKIHFAICRSKYLKSIGGTEDKKLFAAFISKGMNTDWEAIQVKDFDFWLSTIWHNAIWHNGSMTQ